MFNPLRGLSPGCKIRPKEADLKIKRVHSITDEL